VANHKSAKKRARQTPKRTERNRAHRSRVKTAIRAFREAVTGGDKSAIEVAYKTATRILRKAASNGILKKQTASRRVSRMSLAVSS